MMKVNGHTLNIERHFYMDELEETYFEVKKPNGFYCHMDWSGWGAAPTEEDFALWIELDYPDRHDPALEFEGRNVYTPLDSKDLRKIKATRDGFVKDGCLIDL